MNRSSLKITALIGLIILTAVGYFSKAGDLSPPAGPVSPSHKTLTEVEPRIAINAANTPGDAEALFVISAPGSYYLTANIEGVTARHGIKVFSSGVTIDLNGFEIKFPFVAAGDFDGIHNSAFDASNIAIRNGSIRGWPGDGIDLADVGTTTCVIENIRMRYNGLTGCAVGTGTSVLGCVSSNNTGIGIATSSGCVVTASSAASNGIDGFLLGSGTSITGCTAYLNGDDGIQINNGCTVTACTCYANSADGIEASTGSVISNNTCRSNGFGAGNGAGIHVTGDDNRLDNNNCTGADRGIDIDAGGNMIIRNSCSGNTTNWDIVTGNSVAPIVQATTNGVAITGNTYAGSLGSTDPNTNFTY